ncbi:MAG TPA: aminotransferase class V-fold PLP-dependent enzyme [Bryobacteraceae bacterium]|nr:aminotransferase class V-fold PLP-dependent enzyme [Bryobacteraceae bacterium]
MLQLDKNQRTAVWDQVVARLEVYIAEVAAGRVSPRLDPQAVRTLLAPCDFTSPMDPAQAIGFAADALSQWQVHTPHPRYYGLFNPAPSTMGVAADALVAGFNPQLAAWSHSPFAVEVERHLVRAFAARFGYDPAQADGTFTSGGMEANHTAILTALTDKFPDFPHAGLRSLSRQPVFYVSAESHHSFLKTARLCGLGMECVRQIPVDRGLRMRCDALEDAIAEDLRRDFAPFCVAATAGTTNAGAIDPLPEISLIAARAGLWFHVDAAWGGAAVFVPELRSLLNGVERADSITFDAHKWLSVPMGAGVYLTRHATILDRTFRVATSYMPKEAAGLDVVDPHLHSMQWSRRFTGLKVFLSLLVAGWEGYAEAIRHQTAMGAALRGRLAAAGWEIDNRTPLPVVCFSRSDLKDDQLKAIALRVVASGEAWISTTLLGGHKLVLRACITNFLTQESDLAALIDSLARYQTAV